MTYIPLLAVQKEAHTRAKGKRGFGFFMQQGLGKTGTVLDEFLQMVDQGLAQRMVVLCPNSFKGGWPEEAEKWGLKFNWHLFDSKVASHWNYRFVNMAHDKPPVMVVNYEAIRSEATQALIADFVRGKGSYIAADESIQISTHNSSQTKAAISIAKEFDWRRILSGKPMKQGPHDYWSQMRFIGILDGVNYFQWRGRTCKMGGFKAKQVTGVKDEEYLGKIIAPNAFIATKEEWTDLPPKLHTIRHYKMSTQQQKQFDQMYNDFILEFGDGELVAVDAAITKYIKLAQIQAGFIMDETGKVHELVDPNNNPRMETLLDLLENEITGKVIIPYHHRYSGVLLERSLAKYNPAFIEGGMSAEEISAQKLRFNQDPSCRVIRLQTRASKYGHTLLGGPEPINRCSTMVFYENTYSLDDRSQIEDRNHRHGQTADNCLYIDLAGSIIDANMAKGLFAKESLYQLITSAIRSSQAGRG